MDWISWSRTWSTKSTTTTSRRPQRRRRKNSRWKRMYLLLQADQRLKQNHEELPLPAHLQELYLSVKDLGLILSQKRVRLSSYPVSKQTEYSSSSWSITSRRRWCDWILEIKRLSSEQIWELSALVLMKCGRAKCKEAEVTRKDFHSSGQEILYLRALQGHSGRNPIYPSLQDNVLIPDNFFKYIYHVGCAISLRSITNSGLTPGGQNLSKRQTVFFLPVVPMDKEVTRIRTSLDLTSTTSCMVQAENVEKTPRHDVLGRYTACST